MAMIAPLLPLLASGAGAAGASAGVVGTIGTTVSALTGVASGLSAMQAGKSQQRQLEYEARIAELQGRQQAVQINDELIKTMSQNTVAAAASGLQSSGSVAEAQRESQNKAATELSTNLFNTGQRTSGLRRQGKMARREGLLSGMGQIGGTLDTTLQKVSKVRKT